MGAARRLVLGGAILGLFWGGFPRYGIARAENGQSSTACDPAPCTCDDYRRLTCDCKGQDMAVALTSEGSSRPSPHTIRISIRNCRSVTVGNSSLASMSGLRSVDLTNIGNLSLTTQSFRLSRGTLRARISIRDARIEALPSFSFHGDVESMSFENVTIGRVSAFAFANLADTDVLRLENCRIGGLEEQAFKKFEVNYLHVIGGTLGPEVPSRTMNDIEVSTSFILDGVRMGNVRSSAFVIKNPKTVAIQNCVVESMEAEAFDVTARGAVIIKNNNFISVAAGAFARLRSEEEAGGSMPEITFANNTIVDFEEGSIMFDRSSFRPVLESVLVNLSCDCSTLALWRNNLLNYTNFYGRFYSPERGGSPLSSRSSHEPEPIEQGRDTFLCLDEGNEAKPRSFVDFELSECATGDSVMFVGSLIVALALLVAVALALAVWCCRRRRLDADKRWTSVPTSAPDVVAAEKNGVVARDAGLAAPLDSRITMVVPDGRLYRETEFHVVVEKAEPLTTEL